MANRSNAVRRTGKSRCELCNRKGTESNPLTLHHADGDNRNNDPSNFMVLHRKLCHTFGDFIAQFHLHHGKRATPDIIRSAWRSFTWREA